MNIRKDSKVTAHTSNNVVVIGTVTSVKGDYLVVTTPNNVVHDVLKASSTKVSAAEFKVLLAEQTQPKAKTTASFKTNDTKKPNKKAAARTVYVRETSTENFTRKHVIAAMMSEVELSANGAATYYQNFKSGTWAVA